MAEGGELVGGGRGEGICVRILEFVRAQDLKGAGEDGRPVVSEDAADAPREHKVVDRVVDEGGAAPVPFGVGPSGDGNHRYEC